MGGGGVPTELPLKNKASRCGDSARIHMDTLILLLYSGDLPLLGRISSPLRIVHSVQCEGEGSRDAVHHFHRGFTLSDVPPHTDRVVCNVPESVESCKVSL